MANVKVFVSVRDRGAQTTDCINSLLLSTKGKVDIYIYDMNSGEHLAGLMKLYYGWLADGSIAGVFMYRDRALPDVYWSKNFGWSQFLASMAPLQLKDKEFLVMVDNDVISKAGWLDACLALIDDPGLQELGVRVISPYDGPPAYETQETFTAAGHEVDIRTMLTSRFWFARYEWWTSFPHPPANKVMRDGKEDRYPTDSWYYEQMAKRSEVFGVVVPPLVTDPPGRFPSARFQHRIGADVEEFLEKRERSKEDKQEGKEKS